MKHSSINLFVCCLMFIGLGAGSASAQESNVRNGIGISIEPTRLFEINSDIYSYLTTPVSFYIPIGVTSTFRIEPDLGIVSFSSERGSGTTATKLTASNIRIGVGGFYVFPLSSAVHAYVGPRIGFYFLSTNDVSQTNASIGGNFGAEYFADSRFSLGSEVQLNYTSFGQPSGSSINWSRHATTTNALFFSRWYFF